MGGLGSREVLASRPAGRCPMWLALGLNAAWIYPQFWYVTGVTKPCFCHNAGHGRFDIARAVISSEALPNLLRNFDSL